MTELLDVRVVPHTHWDREWYHPAGRFRQRLVALVDGLLDGATHDDTGAAPRPFLLDGQAVVLDDYLAVRPGRAHEVRAALRAGWLEAGPWYVLADELIAGGEALVRNLLAGRRTLAALGAEAPPVLYSPDAFGHAAAMPALAAGFGFALAIAWRGLGGARWPAGDTFRWRAPDGSVVLLHHLPPDGYEFGSSLPVGAEDAAERWARMRAVLAERSRTGVLLVQNGADHHALQAGADRAVALLARAAAPHMVRHSTLRDFADAVTGRAGGAAIPEIAGELRDSYGYTWTLQGTFATRAAQKRRNARVERLLGRDAEPWVAMGALAGRPGVERRAALLRAAWKTLLLCHPHDTLCGCSTDEVARAMDARLDDAESQGEGVRDDAILALLAHDEADARTRVDAWRPTVLVRNAAARPRGGVAEVELRLLVATAPVGPGSAGHTAAVRAAPGSGGRPVTIGDGLVPLQLLDHELAYDRVESPRHYPRNDVVERVRAVAWVPPVGGYAVQPFAIDARSARHGGPLAPPAPVVVADNRMDNGLIAVAVVDGRVRVSTADAVVDIPSLLGFEDVGDAGDLYTHSRIGTPLTSAWFAGAHTVHRGPLRGEVEARWRLRVPAQARPAEQPLARPAARAGRHVEIDLVVRLTLDAGAPFVRVAVHGDNLARDHRLRVVFRTGVARPEVHADAAFGPVPRAAPDVPDEDQRAERVPPTAPLHRYVSAFGARGGVTVYGDGLAEYEARENGEVAVTLVRAVGELSRPDLPERPGHAGWPVPTPQAQGAGPFEGAFAVLPHGPRSAAVAAMIAAVADDVLLPLRGHTLRAATALDVPAGVELEGEGLACSAVKPAEADGWVVLRCVNVTEREVAGAWRIGAPMAEAVLARLDETPLHALDVTDGAVAFTAAPRAIVTILVRPQITPAA